MRLGVLVSGRGSNLAAVLDAVADGRLPEIEPVIVVSNRAGVPALGVAARHGVRTLVVRLADFADGDARDRAIAAALSGAGVELALLAGYDRLLGPAFFGTYRGRTINVHPSLLPAHGGRGMIGLAVHAAVLASGATETGVSVHEVTEALDAGPILAQRRVGVATGDTPERLAARVLAVEHACVIETLRALGASVPVAGRCVPRHVLRCRIARRARSARGARRRDQ